MSAKICERCDDEIAQKGSPNCIHCILELEEEEQEREDCND